MDTLKSSAQLEKLKCAMCKNSLSYFPVKIVCESRQNICGRCLIPDETPGKYIHNEAYETAASFLAFPCRYQSKGCDKNLFPEEVPNHEKSCSFQVVTCPIKLKANCDWKGSLPTLLQHCQTEHQDFFLKNGEFEMKLQESHDFENFMEHEDVLLVTRRKFLSTNHRFLFSVSLYEVEMMNEMYYHVSLKNKNKGVYLDGNITAFNDGFEDISAIILGSLKDQTDENDDMTISVKITLHRKDEHEQISSVKNQNENMLSQLKCSNCSEYVLPPICYSDGQLYCSECKVKVTGKETRSIALDNLARLLDYPCRYRKNGCSFISKADRMEKHQAFCLKGVYSCPVKEYLNCEWKGLGENFTEHINQKHSDIIITNSSEITEDTGNFTLKVSDVESGLKTSAVPETTNGLFGQAVPERDVTQRRNEFTFGSTTRDSSPYPPKGNQFTFQTNPQQPISSFSFAGSSSGNFQPIQLTATSIPYKINFSTTKTNPVDGKQETFYEKCYIISFLNSLFRLSFMLKEKTYSWAVQVIGSFDENFKYELKIIDKAGKNRKLLTKQPCSPMTTKSEIFMKKEYCCFFSVEDISYFLSPEKNLTFKVRIVK